MEKKEATKLIKKIGEGQYYWLDCYDKKNNLLKDIDLIHGSKIDNQEHTTIVDDTLKEVKRIIKEFVK